MLNWLADRSRGTGVVNIKEPPWTAERQKGSIALAYARGRDMSYPGVSEQGRRPTDHDMLPGCSMLIAADGDIVMRDSALN